MTKEEIERQAGYLRADIKEAILRFKEVTGYTPEAEIVAVEQKLASCERIVQFHVIVKVLID